MKKAAGLILGVVLGCGFGVDSLKANTLNKAFGIPLWDGYNLWADNAKETAQRLKLEGDGPVYQKFFAGNTTSSETVVKQTEYGPQQSVKKSITSDDTQILGAKAYMIELYEKKGKVDEVTINFANRADIERTVKSELTSRELAKEYEAHVKNKPDVPFFDTLPNERRLELSNQIALEVEKRLKDAQEKDLAAIEKSLNGLFGKSEGNGSNKKIWTEMRHEFLLLRSQDGFSLKIQKTGSSKADEKPASRYQMTKILAELPSRVDRRGSDVVLTGIPNISQGARNYCTTATWQKVLRYYGISTEIFELAEKGGTTTAGSEGSQFAAKMTVGLKPQGMDVAYLKGSAENLSAYRSYLDRGIPVIWNMDARLLPAWYLRNKERGRSLTGKEITEKELEKLGFPNEAAPHTLLIIGYNSVAKEIALSDSTELGHGEPEIWIRLSEAGLAHKSTPGSQMFAVVPSGNGGASGGGTPVPAYTPPAGKKYY